MCFPSASKSSEGCRALAGWLNWMSSGQKIGQIMGWPNRLIWCQSFGPSETFVAHHTAIGVLGLSVGWRWDTSSTIESTVVASKLFFAFSRSHPERSRAVRIVGRAHE